MKSNVELAKAILAAAKRREESFSHAEATAASTAGKPVDMESFYGLSLRQACETDGVNPFLSFPVYLLLSNSWNNALDWAIVNAERE